MVRFFLILFLFLHFLSKGRLRREEGEGASKRGGFEGGASKGGFGAWKGLRRGLRRGVSKGSFEGELRKGLSDQRVTQIWWSDMFYIEARVRIYC